MLKSGRDRGPTTSKRPRYVTRCRRPRRAQTASRGGTIDRAELPDLPDPLQVANVEGVEEELLARHVRADVNRPGPLDRADMAEGDPLGQWPALTGGEALAAARRASRRPRPARRRTLATPP